MPPAAAAFSGGTASATPEALSIASSSSSGETSAICATCAVVRGWGSGLRSDRAWLLLGAAGSTNATPYPAPRLTLGSIDLVSAGLPNIFIRFVVCFRRALVLSFQLNPRQLPCILAALAAPGER